MKIKAITTSILAALAIGSAYGAATQTANLNVTVAGTTAVSGFVDPPALTDVNSEAVADGNVSQTINNVEIYTDDTDGLTITTTSQKTDANTDPAIEQGGSTIPIALSYTPCGSGTPVELLARDNGSAQKVTTVNTNLATNWSAAVCRTTPGSATITYGGDGNSPPTSATAYTGALTIAVAPINP